MLSETVACRRLEESYTRIVHPSGLTLMLCPMEGFSGAHALFATRCGSIDDSFAIGDEEYTTVPNGIAHFLEHKLFESEEGDAFEQYAKTGASANAYTSFDRTAYLFGCTDNFDQSIEILLNLVTKPYFTEKTVQKEQGIIGQEIRMYDDDPDWRVYFNLLGALYHNHPIRVDIAGTVESISEITAELLYRCYNAFYNLNNMVLSVAGNFDIDTVIKACDKILLPAAPVTVRTREVDEPQSVRERRVEQKLEVATPLFQIGFKGTPKSYRENILAQVTGEIVCDLAVGESTELYRTLYDEGLINASFGSEVMAGPNYLVNIFSGESRNPDEVFARILKGVEELQQNGISAEAFERARRAAYGRYAGVYSSVEAMAGMMVLASLADFSAYEPLELIDELTLNDAQAFLRENFDPARCALSVVRD
ncbi:EF-P 5-aminopentanol modification-associated protein YfmH [Oscillospiraceae bacterium LTW-04]|nr:pitrilysin family protein [Oscillospiraceae bacterium MB24-C1]